jgi:transcriptional regulator with XRE-family HTH domain
MAADRNPLAVAFGENLRACRRRVAISQEDLGQRASLHRTEIRLLERGARVPRIDTLVKLASALAIWQARSLFRPKSVSAESTGSPTEFSGAGSSFQDPGDAPVE